MSADEIVRLLDEIDGGDPEVAHSKADSIILEALPPEVTEAYDRLVARCNWWACA